MNELEAKFKKIGGRVVETCFTCGYERNGCCTMHDIKFVGGMTQTIFCCDSHRPIPDTTLSMITAGISELAPRLKTQSPTSSGDH